MVSRPKIRTFLNTLALYAGCALVIGYFAVNAYTGNHGLRAQQDLDQQFASLNSELSRLKDERARAVLNYLDPRDLTLMLKQP